MRVFLTFLFCTTICNGAKILGVFNHPGTSHTILGKVLLKNLARKGHDVVMISSFPVEEPVQNYRDIFLQNILEDLKRRNQINQNKAMGLQELRNMTLHHTEDSLTHPEVKELLRSKETFDLILVDWFYNDATLILGHIYKAPVVYISSFGNMALLSDLAGNVLPMSYVPGAGLYLSDDMSFMQRTVMSLITIGLKTIFLPRSYNAHYELLKRHFDNPPTIEELQENVALILSNSHFSFETPRPYTPNIIPVGGFHVEEPKELPQDLQKFLDHAKEGVIFFSLGSQVVSSNLNNDTFSVIIKSFKRFPQKVLWKYELHNMVDIPSNVKIMTWVPQVDVLAHPNVKLFISHGGMLSLIEAIHYEVPLICLPFFGDQFTNAAFVETRKIGRVLSPDNITEEGLFNTIQEVLTNLTYEQNIRYRSSLLREQAVKPLDNAIYWIEHVIKHRQANHLKTFATKLPWYKYYLVDVISFFLGVMFILTIVTIYVLKKVYNLFCSNKKSKVE